MSRASTESADTAAQDFLAVQTLLSRPSLAFLYTDLLVHSPTRVGAARERNARGWNGAPRTSTRTS